MSEYDKLLSDLLAQEDEIQFTSFSNEFYPLTTAHKRCYS